MVNSPAAVVLFGMTAVVVALWLGVGQTAGCIGLGTAGVALIITGIAAVAPDRSTRRARR